MSTLPPASRHVLLLNSATCLGAHYFPNTRYALDNAAPAHDAGGCNQEFTP
jgi:hypothetical protein